MPRKRKSNLSSKSRSAKRISLARNSEASTKRVARLAVNRTRAATNRLSETSPEREARLNANRARVASHRLSETDIEREARQGADRARTSANRLNETISARQVRQATDRQQNQQARHQVPRASLFSNPGSAVHYDSANAYADDPQIDIGGLNKICHWCDAKKFAGEAAGMCCSGGKVHLPLLAMPPQPLSDLLLGTSAKSALFLSNTRSYNSAFQMTSFGASREINEPGFMPTFKVQGQVYHLIGSLLPDEVEPRRGQVT